MLSVPKICTCFIFLCKRGRGCGRRGFQDFQRGGALGLKFKNPKRRVWKQRGEPAADLKAVAVVMVEVVEVDF